MRERLKSVKADVGTTALITVALGVVLLFWPAETIEVFCRVLAAGLIIMGAVQLISYFAAKLLHPFAGIIGAVILLVGLWIFISPQSVVSLIPIVIGVVLFIHGLQDIKLALEAKSNGYGNWGVMFIIAFVGAALGVLCIVDAFGVVALATQIIGVALIYDGVTDLWIIFKTVKAERDMRREEKALDVEYKEVDE